MGRKNLKLEAKPNERCEKWERVNTKEGRILRSSVYVRNDERKNAARQHEREKRLEI